MNHKVVLIKGDGIGPEIADAVVDILNAAGAPIEWVERQAGLNSIGQSASGLPQETLDAVREYGIALKGPTTTPVGTGHKSVNVTLRKTLELYANVRPARTMPGVETRFSNVDLIIVRENIEDTYAGIEHGQTADVAQGLKLITRPGSIRIARYAFEMARALKRNKVIAVHKANIHKLTDGLFLECFREVSKSYPEIETGDIIVDNCCMQLVTRPEQFDVLVCPNLYGDIVSDLCAGLVGGLGVAPGGNIGEKSAVFEAVHGSAPDIAGKGLANPTALLLSAIQMLQHLGYVQMAFRIQHALERAMKDGVRTRDLGGNAGTTEFAQGIIDRLEPHLGEPEKATPIRVTVDEQVEHHKVKKEFGGIDVFIQYDNGLPPMPKQVGPFSLRAISNRGTKVYPGEFPADILLVDHHRCCYLALDENGVERMTNDEEVLALLQELSNQGLYWMHVEKLQYFNGKPAYAKVQGE